MTVTSVHPTLVDTFGRVATDLRVSLTDRCNLRCSYCMPAEGLRWQPLADHLTDDEVVRLVRIAVQRLGVREVRFTGGEPLLRPGLADIVAATASLDARPDVSLTTNGIGLAERVGELVAAGLRRVNVSLDTLDRERFRTLARRDRWDDVVAGLTAARDAGLDPVKVNAVLIRGVNDDEAPRLLRFCLEQGLSLRFIEQMPLDGHGSWQWDQMVTADEILASLRAEFTLTPMHEARGSAPAERWYVDGGPATVGVIASVTRPFCRTCSRTRLTADGQVRTCLFSTTETDLRALLRQGADDDAILDRWRTATMGKAAGHGLGTPAYQPSSRTMSAIGG